MVKKPDPYTQQKRFLAALRDPLHCEVLSHGYTAEFSRIEDLISTAQAVEDAVQYDLHRYAAHGGIWWQPYPSPTVCTHRGVAQHIPKASAGSADPAKGNGELRSAISDADQVVCTQGC